MKQLIQNKKIIYGIIAVIILLAIASIYFFRLNFSLMYKDNVRLDVQIGKQYSIKDIKQIAKEVFNNQNIQIHNVENFGDTVAITVEYSDEELINSLKEKIKEKYALESTDDLVQTTNVPHLRGRDIVKPYIIPTAIVTALIIVYVGIRYIKIGILKTAGGLLLKLVISQLLYLSIIAIFRIPIGIYIMPISILLYLLVLIITIIGYQNKLDTIKQEKNQKKLQY